MQESPEALKQRIESLERWMLMYKHAAKRYKYRLEYKSVYLEDFTSTDPNVIPIIRPKSA